MIFNIDFLSISESLSIIEYCINDVRATHSDNINWKALYKVLESEVETIVLDPNCPQYVKDWGQRIMQRLAQHLPR